ncbi:MAG: hypothetical protein V4719_27250 [Planctomycetota bacterium]
MIELLITAQGVVRALYSETIPIRVLGRMSIERASHVEPDSSGNWWADLEPSQGPLLGPFVYRSEALQAEHDWLTQHVLFGPPVNAKKVENLIDDEPPFLQVPSAGDAVAGHAFQASARDPAPR